MLFCGKHTDFYFWGLLLQEFVYILIVRGTSHTVLCLLYYATRGKMVTSIFSNQRLHIDAKVKIMVTGTHPVPLFPYAYVHQS